MNSKNNTVPSEAQTELLKFINPTDAKDIASSMNNVFKMALFGNDESIAGKQKDDLFVIYKLISITANIGQ